MSASDSYLGAKSGSGVYQAIINLMPPHETYIEAFLGTGAVMQRKAPAQRNIGLDLSKACIDGFDYAGAVELHCVSAFNYLANFDYKNAGSTLVYCDPPYVHSTRTSKARYEYELTDNEHRQRVALLQKIPARVILSGYRNEIYDELLANWWSMDFQAMTRGGVRTETVWCNFTPGEVHYHTFAGKNFTDRQRIKRKAQRWANDLAQMPAAERQAILAALLSAVSNR